MSHKLEELSTVNFVVEIGGKNGISIVEFGNSWCTPCKNLSSTLELLAENFSSQARVFTVNVDDEPYLAASYGVQQLPTTLLFKDGELYGQVLGHQSYQVFAKELTAALGEKEGSWNRN